MILSKKKKIFFISHDCSLTGAPILLLNLLSLLSKKNFFDIQVVLGRGGILEKEFLKYGNVTILKSKNYSRQTSFFLRSINFLIYKTGLFLLNLKLKKADIIFSNTIVNGKVLKHISKRGVTIITYVHELESIIQEFHEDANLTFQFSDLYISPSKAVAENLISRHSVLPENISFLNYYFPIPGDHFQKMSKMDAKEKFKKYLQFSENKFYVVGMGVGSFRKGIDLFIEAAQITNEVEENIHFVWIGELVEEKMKSEILNKIATYQLQNTVTITGQLPYSLNNLLPFDLFVLTSREDPYPLVILEAALMKIPSVCFANTGGIQEFVSNNCGWVVDEISPKKLAEKIIGIKNNPGEISRRGENAFKKCLELHTDEDLIYAQFVEILEKANNLKRKYDHQSTE